LAKASPGQELPKDERAETRKNDEDSEYRIVDPVGNHHEEDDV
jgi:hypothetical protein